MDDIIMIITGALTYAAGFGITAVICGAVFNPRRHPSEAGMVLATFWPVFLIAVLFAACFYTPFYCGRAIRRALTRPDRPAGVTPSKPWPRSGYWHCPRCGEVPRDGMEDAPDRACDAPLFMPCWRTHCPRKRQPQKHGGSRQRPSGGYQPRRENTPSNPPKER